MFSILYGYIHIYAHACAYFIFRNYIGIYSYISVYIYILLVVYSDALIYIYIYYLIKSIDTGIFVYTSIIVSLILGYMYIYIDIYIHICIPTFSNDVVIHEIHKVNIC